MHGGFWPVGLLAVSPSIPFASIVPGPSLLPVKTIGKLRNLLVSLR